VTGNASDDYVRRAPGTAGKREGVRYQIYATKDGHVLFMASEQEFWKNFCAGVDRMDLFERWPGSKYADHARGNRELQAELRDIFATRTSQEWMEFGGRVNTPKTLPDDPQFSARLGWIPASRLGADQLPFPVRFVGEGLPVPMKAPTPGEHTYEVLRAACDYDDEQIAKVRKAGALGQ
jgi:crotonobetainyl-CoA:carnitine CoA-transferase CaiB-like acyl-CoA transferase